MAEGKWAPNWAGQPPLWAGRPTMVDFRPKLWRGVFWNLLESSHAVIAVEFRNFF
jgi:hypothetical protein